MRQIGIEEELLLVDPSTGQRANVSRRVLREHAVDGPGTADATDELDGELLQHMVETHTDPRGDVDRAVTDVRRARRTAIRAARAAGVEVAATGTSPVASPPTRVTPDDRYERIVRSFGSIGRAAGTTGMHVHVEIADDAEGIRVLDGIRPWLPVLVAVAANSPYDEGQDTGYASWRHQVWTRWPAAGPAEPFGTVAEYRRVCEALIDSGAALDAGMLYFDARLAQAQPTVEIRVADVCTDVADAALVAALARGLVETAATDAGPSGPTGPSGPAGSAVRTDLLRAAHWRASRDGLAGRLLQPSTGRLLPAREVLAALVEHVDPALRRAGDGDRVRDGVERLRTVGGGAQRQRQAYERTGDLAAVVADLVARTAHGAASA